MRQRPRCGRKRGRLEVRGSGRREGRALQPQGWRTRRASTEGWKEGRPEARGPAVRDPEFGCVCVCVRRLCFAASVFGAGGCAGSWCEAWAFFQEERVRRAWPALQAAAVLEPRRPSAGFRARGGGRTGSVWLGEGRGVGAIPGAHWCLVTPQPGILGLHCGCRAGTVR